jgi:hypothetical protein
MSDHPMFCVCDDCCAATAREHATGDRECGREWVCACAACKRTRTIEWEKRVRGMFDDLKEKQERLAAIRAVKGIA